MTTINENKDNHECNMRNNVNDDDNSNTIDEKIALVARMMISGERQKRVSAPLAKCWFSFIDLKTFIFVPSAFHCNPCSALNQVFCIIVIKLNARIILWDKKIE